MLLPSSVRRVVAAAPPAGGLVCALAASAPKAAAAAATVVAAPVFARSHQRRFSSSKPSRPDKGSSNVAAGQSVPASSASRTDAKAAGEKRKRKAKDASERGAAASFRKLPSVPSTRHMSQEGEPSARLWRRQAPPSPADRRPALGLSSFFSLHRPISITQTMPRTVTDEHFASIFAPRNKANKVADAMSTISGAIDQLDGPMARMSIGGHHDEDHGDGVHKVEVRNPDGSESSVYLQVDTMSGDFLPFRPPPLPEAQPLGAEADGLPVHAHAVGEAPHHRVYKAMFTIEESTEPDGHIRIVAHSPRIVSDEQPRSFVERMARRQARFDEAQAARRRDMMAISVKRQRKLRMKKKKYKKLMKRTRNLRRKLDRT